LETEVAVGLVMGMVREVRFLEAEVAAGLVVEMVREAQGVP
jgi:hypothetical protein